MSAPEDPNVAAGTSPEGSPVADSSSATGRPPESASRAPDCPGCGQGYLFMVGRLAEGVHVHCFMCNRGFSVHDSEGTGEPVAPNVAGPTIAQPTTAQVDAIRADVPEHPVHGNGAQ